MKETFKEYMHKTKPEINKRLQDILSEEDTDISTFLEGGKKMRGCLCILISDSLNKNNDKEIRKKALDLACVVEISHAMSLLVDDAIDDDKTRRGKPTLHELVGYKMTMLHVIKGLTYPYIITGKYGKEYTTNVAKTMRIMSRGALTEFKDTLKGIVHKKLPATALYDAVITAKTGKLFELATRFGAMSATNNQDIIDYFATYDLHTGRVMQIADDIHDRDRLLLKCLTVDSLIGELVEDIKTRSVDPLKATELWSDKRVVKVLGSMIHREVNEAGVCVDKVIQVSELSMSSLLKSVPLEIVNIMLREQDGGGVLFESLGLSSL